MNLECSNASAVLTRGRASVASGQMWVDGKGGSIGRYVNSDSNRAQVAHLISGWKQDVAAGQALLLSTNALTAAYLWGHLLEGVVSTQRFFSL